MKLFNNKRCPRCKTKMPTEIVICPSCQLNFVKFIKATNQEAKQAIKENETDRVLLMKGCPTDVSRIKLILITIFLGMFGGHYYYVGRYKMGAVFTIFFAVGIVNTILSFVLPSAPSGDLYQIFTLLVLGWGFVLIMWIVDIAKVCVNTFKIPVSRSS